MPTPRRCRTYHEAHEGRVNIGAFYLTFVSVGCVISVVESIAHLLNVRFWKLVSSWKMRNKAITCWHPRPLTPYRCSKNTVLSLHPYLRRRIQTWWHVSKVTAICSPNLCFLYQILGILRENRHTASSKTIYDWVSTKDR